MDFTKFTVSVHTSEDYQFTTLAEALAFAAKCAEQKNTHAVYLRHPDGMQIYLRNDGQRK